MFKKMVKFLLGQPEGYVSPADEFLTKLRKENPKLSESQVAEIAKYKRVNALRDAQHHS